MNTTPPPPPPRHITRWLIVSIIGMLLLTFLILHLIPTPPLELGPDTTVITAPLHADGTPNYFEALGAIRSAGVTSENNAMPLLLRALGLENIEADLEGEILQQLGLSKVDFARGPRLDCGDGWLRWQRTHMEAPSSAPSQYDIVNQPTASDWFEMSMYDAGEVLRVHQVAHPQLAAWLDAHEPCFKLIEEASRKTYRHFPTISRSNPPTIMSATLPQVMSYRQITDALTVRGLMRLRKGSQLGAWQDTLTFKRLACQKTRASTRLEIMAGHFMFLDPGTRLGLELLAQNALPERQLREILAELLQLNADPDLWTSAIGEAQQLIICESIVLSWKGRETTLWPWDVNAVLRRVNTTSGKYCAALKQPTFMQRFKALSRITVSSDELPKLQGWLLNAGGAMAIEQRSGIFAAYVEKVWFYGLARQYGNYMQALARHNLLIVALALSIHHAEDGAYPENLQQLVPGILPQVPLDTFSDKPFVYQRTADGYLLYSVGENMIDDAGAAGATGDDITVRMPPPPKPAAP